MYSMFDEVLEKAKMVADIATKKTGEAVEISKYKVEALRLNNQIKHLHEQLGCTIYSMTKHDYDNPDLVESLVDEIDETILMLEAVNEKIAELKNVSRCDVCGAKNIEENYFCCRCGSKIKNNFEDGFYNNKNGEKMNFDGSCDCGCGDDCGDDCNCDCNDTSANDDCSCGCGDDCGDNCDCNDDCNCDCNDTSANDDCSCGCGDDCGDNCDCNDDCNCDCNDNSNNT